MGKNCEVVWIEKVFCAFKPCDVMGEKIGFLDLVVKLKSQNMIRNGFREASGDGIIFPEELCKLAVSLEVEVVDGKDVVAVTL